MAATPKDVVVTVRFTEDEAEALRNAADLAEKSVSALVRNATVRHIKAGRMTSVSSGGTISPSATVTGTAFPGQAIGTAGQPVGGNLKEVLND